MSGVLFDIEGHATQDRNSEHKYNTLLIWVTPGNLYSVYNHRQFHTLLGFLHNWAALSNSYPNASYHIRKTYVLSYEFISFYTNINSYMLGIVK